MSQKRIGTTDKNGKILTNRELNTTNSRIPPSPQEAVSVKRSGFLSFRDKSRDKKSKIKHTLYLDNSNIERPYK